jgi:flavodoxin I
LHDYIESHHGRLLLPVLRLVDEPYGQEEVILGWGRQLADVLRRL